MNARIIVLFIAALCVNLVARAEDDISQTFTIIRHFDVTFDALTARAKLDSASLLLRTKDRASDYGCCINLVFFDANVDTFGAPGDTDDVVDSEAKLRRILAISSARVKVVTALSWCGTPGTYLGCSDQPGKSIVIVASAASDVWAHEFGHNQGLPHRDSSIHNIMHSTASNTDEINQMECDAFRMNGTDTGTCAIQH